MFSVPASQAVIPKWTGLSPSLGIELGRLVLWDDCEANSESWFMARAFRLLAQALPEVQAVLSFSDPVQRTSATGTLLTPGHVGVVYQALGARHVGRSNPRTRILDPAGRTISERALTKLRNDDRGAQYTYNQLRAAGAPRRHPNEPGHTYVTRALTDGAFRRMRHPGIWPMCGPLRMQNAGSRRGSRRSCPTRRRSTPSCVPAPRARTATRIDFAENSGSGAAGFMLVPPV